MPGTKKRKKPANTPVVRDADQVIRQYEESDATPGGDFGEKYTPNADAMASNRSRTKRTVDEVGCDAVSVHGGDIDAGLDRDQAGEESIGGSNPTPDQDLVDEIGAGAGLTYRDDEPVDPGKVARRDDNRWELNPESSEDYPDRQRS
jgi:hypothetical protein